MLDELKPMTLTEAAKALGTDPFELVRVMVASGIAPQTLGFTREQVDRLRQAMEK